eukprot:gb/GECH01007021.1/.p1 GENE.gb/GECH01007021.1/~~gb/GECH01007021.1/.p1  ORF type:complete len:2648 (+),score=561.77 gb/GECH01007021.1/:1-7944(+)
MKVTYILFLLLIWGSLISLLPTTTALPLNRAELRRTQVDKDSYVDFTLDSVDLKDDETLFVVVESFSGTPLLYINYENPARIHDFQWKAIGDQQLIGIKKKSDKYRVGVPFQISVFGSTDSDFGIVAYTHQDRITLQEGIPLLGGVDQSDYIFMQFPMVDNSSDIEISVSSISGDADVYVSTSPDPVRSNATWSSRNYGDELIYISADDPDYMGDTTYYLGVYAASDSIFSITFARNSPQVSHLLPSGIPHRGYAPSNEYVHYKFQLYGHHSLSIEASVFGGDVDLYVSNNGTASKDNYQWRRMTNEDDYIHIKTDDPNYIQGTYYISVFGFLAGEFEITAVTQGNNVVLEPGQPTHGAVDEHEYKYFKFSHIDTEENIIITTSTSKGQVKIYGSSHISQPHNGTAEYESFPMGSSDAVIYIPRSTNSPGWYYFGVLGIDTNNEFEIIAKTNETAEELELNEVSLFNSVPKGSYRYFYVDLEYDDHDLTVTSKSIVGDADLYLSNNYPRPTTEHYQWKSTQAAKDTVTAFHTDPGFSDNSRFYIGVYGFAETEFSILAFQSNETIPLHDNEPTPGYVTENKYVFYSFDLPHSGEFIVELDVDDDDNGDADIYASNSVHRPNRQNYDYKSTSFGDTVLNVDGAEKGTWYIGVYGVKNTSFVIQAAVGYITLDSRAIFDQVMSDNYRNYRLDVNQDMEAIVASVTLVSGSTDLYLSLNSEDQNANKNNSDTSDHSFPGNVLLLQKDDIPAEQWQSTWSLSVFGSEPSAYFISAGEAGVLQLRVPRLSVSDKTYTSYFVFTGTRTITDNLELQIADIQGQVHLYVSQENDKPDKNHNRWEKSGTDEIWLEMNKEDIAPGPLFMAVESPKMPSKFVVTLYQKNDPLLLVDAIPDRGSAAGIDLSHYSALTAQAEELSVVVESCDDHPGAKFFGSFEGQPTGVDHQFKSHHLPSNQFVSVKTVPANSSEEFFVAVSGGSSGSEFSIVSYPGEVTQNPIPGDNGTLSGTYSNNVLSLELTDSPSGLYPHHYAVYVLEVDIEDDIPNLHTVCAVEEKGTWYVSRQLDSKGGKVTLDVHQLSNDKVYGINVVLSNDHGMKSVYTPIWLVEGSVQDNPKVESLSLGVPKTQSAGDKSFKLLKLPAVDLKDNEALFFTVASLSGDPELFINYDDYPSQNNFVWSSKSATTEYIKINEFDNRYRAGKEYFVGVFGYTATDFVILAYTKKDTVHLNEGQPLLAVASSGEQVYFQWHLPGNSSFQITGVPLEGDVDLYVDTQPHPSSNRNSWKSAEFGSDFIEISQDDNNFEPDSDYYISGKAFGNQAIFILTIERISGDVIRTAMDSVPQIGDVAGQEDLYYSFDLKHKGSLFIQLELTQADGDADLFVSTEDKRPSEQTAQWKATQYGDDYIHIKTSDDHWKQGEYYITVHGVHTTTFLLTVFTEGNNVILTQGEPETGTSDFEEYRYYKFHHDDTKANILLTAGAEKGRITMFVSDTVTRPQNETGKYDFQSIAEDNSEALVYIPAEQNKATWYYIGVYGEDPYNKYTLLAHTNQTEIELLDGQVSTDNYVPEHHYRRFVFERSSDPRDVTISVSPKYGDADIYVSNTIRRPSKDQYTWKASNFGTDSVVIEKDDPKLEKGHKFHIAVYGWMETYFSIIAFRSDHALELEDDVPTPGYVKSGDYVYYKFDLPSKGTFLITLDTQESGQDADVYVGQNAKPNEQNCEYSATSYGSVSLRVEDAEQGTWYIGVLGQSAETSFSIRFTTQSLTLLLDGDPVLDQTNHSEYRSYRFNVPNSIDEFSLSAVLVNGVTEMYLSTGEDSEPTRHNNLLSDTSYPGNVIQVRKQDHPQVWEQQECSLSIYGVRPATYMISLSSPIPTVSLHEPHLSEVKSGSTKYFSLIVPEVNGQVPNSLNLFVTLEDKNTLVDVFASQEEQKPDKNNHKWSSMNSNHHELHFKQDDLVGGSLYISIHALEDPGDHNLHRFVLTGLEEGDDILLISGFYATLTTKANTHQYFSSRLFSDELYLMSQSCDDRPAPSFYANSESGQQFPSNKDKQDQYSQFIITQEAPQEETYSINVNGGKQGAKYQLYPSGHNHNRPKFGNNGRLAGVYKNNMLLLEVTDSYEAMFPHNYEVFVREITNDTSVNVHTSCALRDKASPSTSYVISNPDAEKAGNKFYLNVPGLSDDRIYGINVILTNGLHVEQPSQPIYLVKGHVHDDPGKSSLARGKSFYDFVEQGEFDQFILPAVEIENNDALHITVTEISGDATLYVNYDSRPSLDKSVWNTSTLQTDVITIRNNDDNYQKGKDLYIGVYGQTESDYNIIAYLNNDTISVQDSVPTVAVTDFHRYTYFKWFLSAEPEQLISHSKLPEKSTLETVPFYAKTEACNDESLEQFFVGGSQQPRPTAKSHDFVSNSDHSGYIQELLTNTAANTDYYLGVKGTKHPFFSLTASSEPSILPNPGNDGNITGSYENGILTLNFTAPSGFSNLKYTFYVYAREYHGSSTGSEINVNTVCALKDMAHVVANNTFKWDTETEYSMTISSLSSDKIYGVNIVASTSSTAAQSAYQPIWLVKGKVQSNAKHNGGSNTGKIVGAVIGTLGGIALISGIVTAVVFVWYRRRRSGFTQIQDGNTDSDGHEHTQGTGGESVNTYGSIQD